MEKHLKSSGRRVTLASLALPLLPVGSESQSRKLTRASVHYFIPRFLQITALCVYMPFFSSSQMVVFLAALFTESVSLPLEKGCLQN